MIFKLYSFYQLFEYYWLIYIIGWSIWLKFTWIWIALMSCALFACITLVGNRLFRHSILNSTKSGTLTLQYWFCVVACDVILHTAMASATLQHVHTELCLFSDYISNLIYSQLLIVWQFFLNFFNVNWNQYGVVIVKEILGTILDF